MHPMLSFNFLLCTCFIEGLTCQVVQINIEAKQGSARPRNVVARPKIRFVHLSTRLDPEAFEFFFATLAITQGLVFGLKERHFA